MAFWSLAILMSWRTLLSVAFGYIILTKSCTSRKDSECDFKAATRQYWHNVCLQTSSMQDVCTCPDLKSCKTYESAAYITK